MKARQNLNSIQQTDQPMGFTCIVTIERSSDRHRYFSWTSSVYLQLNNFQQQLNILYLGTKTVFVENLRSTWTMINPPLLPASLKYSRNPQCDYSIFNAPARYVMSTYCAPTSIHKLFHQLCAKLWAFLASYLKTALNGFKNKLSVSLVTDSFETCNRGV